MTGALIRKISTGEGSVTTPSGLTQIRAWADNTMFNNTAQRVYGGDMLGNLWRFDINDNLGPAGYEAFLMATLRDGANNPQPLTAKPELGDVNGNPVVYVGTGRYLGLTDVTDVHAQSIYAIKDNLSAATGYGNPRNSAGFVRQTLTRATCPDNSAATTCTPQQQVMTGTNATVDMNSDNGWYVDLPTSGERASSDPQLALGTLSFTTNIPDATPCTAGGYSNIYFFDYRSGAPVSTSSNAVAGKQLGNSLATRPVFARLPNNNVIAIVRLSDGSTVAPNVPVSSTPVPTRRLSWRVLINEN
jgi:type IV pilus assembly protein PilY1